MDFFNTEALENLTVNEISAKLQTAYIDDNSSSKMKATTSPQCSNNIHHIDIDYEAINRCLWNTAIELVAEQTQEELEEQKQKLEIQMEKEKRKASGRNFLDGLIPPPCYLNINLSAGAKLTQREAAYLEYNVLYMRMNQRLQELTQRTGMPITQENGQRRYGPPENYNGPPVERGSEVFVGKLPRDLFEDELVPVFEKAGDIFEVRLMMDFSGTNRGYCFVQYYTSEAASKAIKMFNDFEIRPARFLGVVKSVDNCRLFIGGIPRDKTRDDIFIEIKNITEGVVRVIANPSPMDRNKNRGYAFIEYESHRSAAMARRKLIPGKIQMWGVTVAVDWAEPEPDVMNLYVRNVTMNTTEDDLRNLFNLHSRNGVDKVKKIKDYAFIHFLSRSQAEEALKALDNTDLNGATLEISWAKPVNKVMYKAKKALAKQLYSHPGNHGKGGNYDVGSNSDRIFGQYNSLSCVNNQQIIYHQMTQQPYQNGIGEYPSFQYRNGSLYHESGQNGRNAHNTAGAYGNFIQSGQFVHSFPHSKSSLFAQETGTDNVYGSYSSGGHGTPGMYIPISPGHPTYRNGPILTQMTPYMTPQLGIGVPYIL